MISEIINALLRRNNYQRNWRKKNPHNYTNALNNFKQYSVNVGKGTYGDLHVITREYQDVCLRIGSYCSIGGGVVFLLSGNHKYDIISTYPYELLVLQNDNAGIAVAKGNIVVGDDVWIGQNAIICSGVKIGQGAIIAAGAVITKDVEPYSIVGGNPARFIKYRFNENIRQKLMNIDIVDMFERIKLKGTLIDLRTPLDESNIDKYLE